MIQFITHKQNRSFMRLWLAQLISQFGDRIHQMALIGLIAERTPGSTLGLAKLLSFTIIPVFIVGPVAGVFVDRWDNRKTLFICDVMRGILVLFIPFIFIFWKNIVPIYILVFLIFCFSRFHVPAKMSIIPDLVHKDHLLAANSLITTTGMIAFVLGCALGGFLVDWFGARGGFIIDAATFFVSGLLVITIPKDFHLQFDPDRILKTGQEMLAIERSFWREMKGGIHYLFGNKGIRFVMQMLFILLAAAGAVYVVIIVFVQESFQSVTKDLGVLAVFLGVGLFLGAMGYGRWGKKMAWHKTIFYCLIAGGIMMLAFATAVQVFPNMILASFLALSMGLVIGPVFIAANTITHVVSEQKMRGKVFAALEIVIHLAFLVAMLASSLLSEYVGRVWILLGVGVIFSGVGVFGAIRFRNRDPLAIDRQNMA